MMLKRSAVMAAILLTAGCAAQADLNYRKPTQPSLTNSRTVNAGFEETWNRLVRNPSSEFFVINNIEKAYRIINVIFQTDAPERYVDCGVTHPTSSSPTGQHAVYTSGAACDPAVVYGCAEDWAVGEACVRKCEKWGEAC